MSVTGRFGSWSGAKNIFQKTDSVKHNLIWVSNNIRAFRNAIPREWTHRWTGQKDRQTLFYTILWATTGGPKIWECRIKTTIKSWKQNEFSYLN